MFIRTDTTEENVIVWGWCSNQSKACRRFV